MKIVVIGGTGLIVRRPSPFCARPATMSAPASPESGINGITGEGLKEAMAGAQVVIELEPAVI